ncbi:16S rRNA (cytidine(1402)-2'-O)-methyltransferase [Halodurantibacterium flavum]|uniref:Ribosomal RNA small subunit methyltransferase I n=1 Tax=Halodurantibacterium flavum TaxID=1382802 RepID=A0ABW4S9U1_9RHOB
MEGTTKSELRSKGWAQVAALPKGLYFVSTPIGAARDITLRALDILASADLLVAEDTRTLRHLMEIHGVDLGGRHILAYHDHNGEAMRPRILRALAEGQSVAYASEAGTPLVADPGYQLSRAALSAGHKVLAAPGASAALAALAVAGLPTDRFYFAGFPPAQAGARKKYLTEAAAVPATLIFYESPKRVGKFLTELADILGAEREAVVCRELTKRYEEVLRGNLGELAARLADQPVKGEVVVLVDRARGQTVSEGEVEDALRSAMAELTMKDAVAQVATSLDLPRRRVYQMALRLERE